jgi:hypothetical protein
LVAGLSLLWSPTKVNRSITPQHRTRITLLPAKVNRSITPQHKTRITLLPTKVNRSITPQHISIFLCKFEEAINVTFELHKNVFVLGHINYKL